MPADSEEATTNSPTLAQNRGGLELILSLTREHLLQDFSKS